MADISRTLEIPNRVPGKLVFGRRRILAAFAPSAEIPDILCPPVDTDAEQGAGVGAGQSIADLHQSVTTSKEVVTFTSFADSNLSVGTSIEVSDP